VIIPDARQDVASTRPVFEAWTITALVVALVARPLLYTLLPIGEELVAPIIVSGSRPHWWAFHLVLLLFQWMPFLFVVVMLRKTNSAWSTLGLDWRWFVRHRFFLIVVLVVLVMAAFVMPGLHYGETLPTRSKTHFMAAVSTAERLFMILVAASAGICEEVSYRGLPFSRLTPLVGKWLVLPITMVSFLFVHGTPDSIQLAINYLLVGFLFGGAFLVLECRRLELLVFIHFAIDAGMVLAP
jgi:membrane protease YdiL (CAAX protease family)